MPRSNAGFEASDAELLERARRGDDAAFHELVDRHAGRLYRLAFSLSGNAADAEDILQETFSGAFRGLAGFESRSSVKTWLTQILVRQAARHHRSRGKFRVVSFGDALEAAAEPSARSRPDAAGNLDARLDVLTMIETLSPEHRQVIVLREIEGLSYAEIAEALHVPRGTVESRLHRARQELRERFKGYFA